MYMLDEDKEQMYFTDRDGNRKAMEYRYLEYNQDGYVLTIYNEMPNNITNGNKIAIGDNRNFEVGHEFDYLICVYEVDVNNLIVSCGMTKLPESVKFLRKERDNLANALLETQNAINSILEV